MKLGNLVFAILALGAWAAVLLFSDGMDTVVLCYLLLLSVGFIFLHHTHVDTKTILNQLAFLALLGPIGAIAGAVLVVASKLRRHPNEADLAAWFRELSGQSVQGKEQDIAAEIDAGRLRPRFSAKFRSAHELILNGTLAEKREVLTWIVRKRDPRLYPLLEVAVQGPDPIIRSQAASILFRLRDRATETSG